MDPNWKEANIFEMDEIVTEGVKQGEGSQKQQEDKNAIREALARAFHTKELTSAQAQAFVDSMHRKAEGERTRSCSSRLASAPNGMAIGYGKFRIDPSGRKPDPR